MGSVTEPSANLSSVSVPYSSEGRGKGETSLRKPSWALCASCRLSAPSAMGEALPMAQPPCHARHSSAQDLPVAYERRDESSQLLLSWKGSSSRKKSSSVCSAPCPCLLHHVTHHTLQPCACHSPQVSCREAEHPGANPVSARRGVAVTSRAVHCCWLCSNVLFWLLRELWVVPLEQ